MLARTDPNAIPGRCGWIAISREICDHPIVGFGRPMKPANPKRGAYSRAEAWLDLLMEANWLRRRESNKGKVIWIERGQLMGARNWLATRWNWTESAVRVFLGALEGDSMISRNSSQSNGQRRAHFANIITICNYDTYQTAMELADLVDGQSNSQSTANQQPINSQTLNKETRKQEEVEDSSLRSESPPPAPSAPVDGAPAPGEQMPAGGQPEFGLDDPGRLIWGPGVKWLIQATGKTERQIKTLVGKWQKVLTHHELLEAMRGAKAAKGDPVAYVAAIVTRSERVIHETVRRENGRLKVFNGFLTELSAILKGRDVGRALDRINGKIGQHVVGVELEARVRSLAIEMVDQEERWDRQAAERDHRREKSRQDDLYGAVEY